MKKIVVFGAGAVGGSVAAWVAPHHSELYVLDTGKNLEILRDKGITTYWHEKPEQREHAKVRVISDLSEAVDADYIIVAVKNYSLDGVAKLIQSKCGDGPVVVGLQNGVENQQILPKYFSKVIYGIVSYNAWIDEPGVIGYQKRGPLVLGTRRNELQAELRELANILNQGVETVVTDTLLDAAHCKMVINLTNSFTTLVGHKFQPISDPALFQKLLTNLTYEGVQIIRAAGFKECRLGGMPSWLTITAAAKLPAFIIKPLFDKNVKKMVLSSMAQDILQRGGSDSELESLNGYFLKLADAHGLRVPFNRAVYELCRENFGKPGFNPMDVKEVWSRVQTHMKGSVDGVRVAS